MQSLKDLLETRSTYPDHPVFASDWYQLTFIAQLCAEYWLTSSSSSSSLLSNELDYLWSAVDLLFNNSVAFHDAYNFSRHVFCLHSVRQKIHP